MSDTTKIVSLNAGPKAPADLSRILRELADLVDRGEITALVAGYTQGNVFQFQHSASIRDGLELSTLLQYRCLKRYET